MSAWLDRLLSDVSRLRQRAAAVSIAVSSCTRAASCATRAVCLASKRAFIRRRRRCCCCCCCFSLCASIAAACPPAQIRVVAECRASPAANAACSSQAIKKILRKMRAAAAAAGGRSMACVRNLNLFRAFAVSFTASAMQYAQRRKAAGQTTLHFTTFRGHGQATREIAACQCTNKHKAAVSRKKRVQFGVTSAQPAESG
jgi:hypothetical protein